jgi:TP901-1 family phage major tail protein
VNGTDILILVNTGTDQSPTYTAVGSQRGATLDETNEEIDMSSKDSRAGRVIAGRYGSTISLDGLYVPSNAAYQALVTASRAGNLIKIRVSEEGTETEEADALITTMSKEAPDQDAAVISIELTIDGEWETVGS